MYSFDAFRCDVDAMHKEGLRSMHFGWLARFTMYFMKLPADWREVQNQAIRDINRGRGLTKHVLDAIGPYLTAAERDGSSVVGSERISEIATLTKLDPRDVQAVVDLQRQFSNAEWRTNFFATIEHGRRAGIYGNLMGWGLVLLLIGGIVGLYWSLHTLLT